MKPFRIRKIEPLLSDYPYILDVGCGFHSPRVTKRYIPKCHYTGIEKPGYMGVGTGPNTAEDLGYIDRHILTDLEGWPDLLALGVKDESFDAVIASNTLEHFTRKTSLHYLATLPHKLKPGGVFFVEVPSHRVFKCFLPSMYDGLEHRAFLDLGDLVNNLLPTCEIIEAGTRRDWWNILRSPVTLPIKRLMGVEYPTEYTDLMGLSSYILARKR